MELHKSIQVPEWNDAVQQKLIDFWQARHIVFTRRHEYFFEGKRGSFWGNLTSFDMSKLMATFTISITHPSEIVCVLNVNTSMQMITEWNKAYWQLEMNTLESWLLYGDGKEVEWQEFLEGARKAAVLWTASGGRKGRKMPPKV